MPSNWNNIIGHDWAVQLLAGAIEHNRVGHAYLITGPEHVGKTTLARTFAQALNCEARGESNQPPTARSGAVFSLWPPRRPRQSRDGR